MDKFEFSRACIAITVRLSNTFGKPEDVWRKVFPTMIYLEIDESEKIQPILGLRSPVAVQEAILRRVWLECFQDEAVPWAMADTETSFGGKGGMEISLMKEAMIAATTDVQAGLKILRDSTLVKETGSNEPAHNAQSGTEAAKTATPVASGGPSSSGPNPTTVPKPAVPKPPPLRTSLPLGWPITSASEEVGSEEENKDITQIAISASYGTRSKVTRG
ncbi:hypothetical protein NUW58_g3478 [Xylaria curta]|uniref:Uncharacterized protein n=1 Tax=Xylaria curta TaxID=42375 RepID=A0ACC1PD38_9PEZI|nr:hypothetical protein NUW58_g3478 [Xylaria curta]